MVCWRLSDGSANGTELIATRRNMLVSRAISSPIQFTLPATIEAMRSVDASESLTVVLDDDPVSATAHSHERINN